MLFIRSNDGTAHAKLEKEFLWKLIKAKNKKKRQKVNGKKREKIFRYAWKIKFFIFADQIKTPQRVIRESRN